MSRVVRHIIAILLVSFCCAMATGAYAQSLFERLVLPGDLTQSHADLQKDCSNCHEDFSKGAQVELCLDCHKEIKSDLLASSGFHGRAREAQAHDCNHCHTDHEGRSAQIILFDLETFDHDQSDFALSGAHGKVECAGCHLEGKKFREAPSTCVDCHKDDDAHDGALGEKCETCHKSTGWQDVSAFDHDTTDFPLKGAHEKVECADCHRAGAYEDLPTACVGCHLLQDVHANRFGEKCETCHSSTKWTEVKFDHDKDTEFRLEGSHEQASCNDCHTQNAYVHETTSVCGDCHANDDAHQGQLGDKCSNCHSTEDWVTNVLFDHEFTDFPLIGQHAIVPCEACHTDLTFSARETDCVACHLADDKHKATLGPDCETCHNPNGWAFWIFDHDTQTDFRLTGAHAGQACAKCHRTPVTEKIEQSTACIACHRRDDVHKGLFGANCAACHSTRSFKGAKLR